MKRRTPYYIPILNWLPQYEWRANFLNDLLAGFAVGMVLIGQCVAYALLAGLPPVVGLYTGWMPVIGYSLLGTSRQLAFGPEGLLSLLVGSVLAAFGERYGLNANQLVGAASSLAMVVGLITLLLGLLRVGFIDNVLSRPVLSGFISASALIILVEQLGPFWGIKLRGATAIQKLTSFFEQITQIHVLTFCLGISFLGLVLVIEYAKRQLAPRWPWFRLLPTALIVLVLGITLGYTLQLDLLGVSVLGRVAGGLEAPALPHDISFWFSNLDALKDLTGSAILITLIGFVESMAVAKKYAAKHHYSVSTNRELVALGFANTLGSFFHTYPAFASLSRSEVSDIAGSSSQIVGLYASCLVLFTILFLMPLFFYLPRVAIAAVIVYAAARMIHLHHFFFVLKLRAWREVSQTLITLVLTFCLGPEVGILASVFISLFFVVKCSTVPHVSLLGLVDETPGGGGPTFQDVLLFQNATLIPGVLIVRVNDSLFFANITQLSEMIRRAEKFGSLSAHPGDRTTVAVPVSLVVFDARNIQEIDPQALEMLIELVADYQHRHITFSFVEVRPELQRRLLAADASNILPTTFCHTIQEALAAHHQQQAQQLQQQSQLPTQHHQVPLLDDEPIN